MNSNRNLKRISDLYIAGPARILTIHPIRPNSWVYGMETPTPITFPIVAMTVMVPFMKPRSCEGETSEQYPGDAFCTRPT